MQNTEIERNEDRIPLKSTAEVERALKEIEQHEQLYSIALFDILGFSNFVENNGTQVILDLYNKLLDLIDQQKSTTDGKASIAGSVVPVPTSQDWKHNSLIADANGFVRVCHFSDTFIIYVNYQLGKQGWWLRDTKYEPNPLLIGEAGTPYCPIFFSPIQFTYPTYRHVWNSFAKRFLLGFRCVDACLQEWPLWIKISPYILEIL